MGEGSRPQHNKNSKQGSPTTPKAAHKDQREDNRKIAGRNTNRKTQHRGATAREEPRRRPKTNRGQGKHGPKQGPGGGQDHEKASKRPPQSNSKWAQITKRCQGTSGTGDRTGQKRTRQVKGRGDKKEGDRYVIPRVYIR